MPTYNVTWVRKVKCSVQVDAPSADDAVDKALDEMMIPEWSHNVDRILDDDDFDVKEADKECMDFGDR